MSSVAAESVRSAQSDRAQSDRARLFERAIRWTGCAILTLIIPVVGLTFGLQVEKWWAEDADVGRHTWPVLADARWSDPSQPLTIDLGDDTWSFCHRVVPGAYDTVLPTLRAECRSIANSTPIIDGVASPAELSLVRALEGRQPIDQQPNSWAMYEYGTLLPMVVATQCLHPSSAGGGAASTTGNSQRVVAWTLGIPKGDNHWAIFSFHPSRSGHGRGCDVRDLPVPPGSEETMRVSGPDGGFVMAFDTALGFAEWQSYFATWIERHQGKILPAGAGLDRGHRLRGTVPYGVFEAMIDIRFAPLDTGSSSALHGLLCWTPSVSSNGTTKGTLQ
jgi:hypothetical protein